MAGGVVGGPVGCVNTVTGLCVCVCGVQVLHSTAVLQVSLDHPPTRSSITTHMQRTIDLSNDIHFID